MLDNLSDFGLSKVRCVYKIERQLIQYRTQIQCMIDHYTQMFCTTTWATSVSCGYRKSFCRCFLAMLKHNSSRSSSPPSCPPSPSPAASARYVYSHPHRSAAQVAPCGRYPPLIASNCGGKKTSYSCFYSCYCSRFSFGRQRSQRTRYYPPAPPSLCPRAHLTPPPSYRRRNRPARSAMPGAGAAQQRCTTSLSKPATDGQRPIGRLSTVLWTRGGDNWPRTRRRKHAGRRF